MEGKARQAALSASATRAAAAAGVKPAALTTRLNPHDKTVPKPVFELTEKKLDPRPAAAKKTVVRSKWKRPAAKTSKGVAGRKETAKHAAPLSKAKPASTHVTRSKPETKRPLQSGVVAHSSIPKPSAAIAKPPASTGSNN
jgi:hypothetical protein